MSHKLICLGLFSTLILGGCEYTRLKSDGMTVPSGNISVSSHAYQYKIHSVIVEIPEANFWTSPAHDVGHPLTEKEFRDSLVGSLKNYSLWSDSGPYTLNAKVITVFAEPQSAKASARIVYTIIDDKTGKTIYTDRVTSTAVWKKELRLDFFSELREAREKAVAVNIALFLKTLK